MRADPRVRRWLAGRVVGPLAVATALALAACSRAPAHPSIVLVILDTTRYDAVSVNGAVRGTTPVLDALAAASVRYTRAYAQANWTVPSHATMFTGLYPHQHGVVGTKSRMPDGVTTLAERLHAAGYETVSVSENPWINAGNGLARGFERATVLLPDPEKHGAELLDAIAEWLDRRSRDRPFFLYVDIMDAHWPYVVRAENPFLPAGVDAAAAAAVSQEPPRYICVDEPRDRELAVLHGLYLGGVAAADRKLGRIEERLRAYDAGPLVTVVAADHGEHFGEHRMVGHDYGVHEQLIHVPLVVHGAPGGAPGRVVSQTVQLADLFPSILTWAGLPVPDGIPARPLPTADAPGGAAPAAFAEYTELAGREPVTIPDTLPEKIKRLFVSRDNCRPEDHLVGDTQALIDYPMKLLRFGGGSTALYDLSLDPGEAHDRSRELAGRTADLQRVLTARLAGATVQASAEGWRTDPDVAARLRALGYAAHE